MLPNRLLVLGLIGNAMFCSTTMAAAAAAGAAGSADIVVQAGSEALTDADVRTAVSGLPAAERAAATASVGSLEQVVRAMVARKALLAEARAKGFDRQPDTLSQLDALREDALVRLWVSSQTAPAPGYPSEAEIKAAYDANQPALAAPTEYRLAQIYVSAPDGGDAAKTAAALRKTADIAARIGRADFAQLAQDQSEQAESAGKGGDMGYVAENRLPAEIAALARNMKPGEVIGPIKTAQGMHFLKLLDRKAGAIPPLPEVHDRLAAALRARRSTELQQNYLAAMNTRLGITVNQIELARLQPTLK